MKGAGPAPGYRHWRGGGWVEINFGGTQEVYLCEFERGTVAREIYPSLDQINKVKTQDRKGFSGRNRKFKRIFRPKTGRDLKKKKKVSTDFARDFPAEIGNSSGFSGRRQVISKKKKKRSSS